MGRKKLEIKARETKGGKLVTFYKRRSGVEKKAQELATLCDIPLLLLLFSPDQRLSWISGSRSTPEEVLKSYAEIPFQERSRRRIEVLEQLNRTFKKTNHEMNVDGFSQLTNETQPIKDLLAAYHARRINLLQELREWENPKTIERASQIEEILHIRLKEIEMYKQLNQANQSMPFPNQVLVDKKALPIPRQLPILYDETLAQSLPLSRHFMVPGDDTPEQNCFDVAPKFGYMGSASQEAWETRCTPTTYEHGSYNLLRDQWASSYLLPNSSSVTPSYLSSSCEDIFHLPSTSPSHPLNSCEASQYWPSATMRSCLCHFSIYSDHSICRANDFHNRSTMSERSAQHENLVLPKDESHASHCTFTRTKGNILSSSDRVVNTQPDAHYSQAINENEDLKFLPLTKNEWM